MRAIDFRGGGARLTLPGPWAAEKADLGRYPDPGRKLTDGGDEDEDDGR